MDKFVRFESGDSIVCIKEYKTLIPGSHYSIKGCGNLTFNADPEVEGRKGYGFCVEDDRYGSFSGTKDWWNLPHNKRIKWYYFTEKEMSEYFITQEEDYRAYRRNEKLNSLGV
jgi:hypothetical protein